MEVRKIILISIFLFIFLFRVDGCGPIKGWGILVLIGSRNLVSFLTPDGVKVYYFDTSKDDYDFKEKQWKSGKILSFLIHFDGKVGDKSAILYKYPYLGKENCIFKGLIKIENSHEVLVRCLEKDEGKQIRGKLLIMKNEGNLSAFYEGDMNYYGIGFTFEEEGRKFYFLTFNNTTYNDCNLELIREITGGVLNRSAVFDYHGNKYPIVCQESFCENIYNADIWLGDNMILFQTTDYRVGIGKLKFDGYQFMFTDATLYNMGTSNDWFSILYGRLITTNTLVLVVREMIPDSHTTKDYFEVRKLSDFSLIRRIPIPSDKSSDYWEGGGVEINYDIAHLLCKQGSVSDCYQPLISSASTIYFDGSSNILFFGRGNAIYYYSLSSSGETGEIKLSDLTSEDITTGGIDSVLYIVGNNIWFINYGGYVSEFVKKEHLRRNEWMYFYTKRVHHAVFEIKNWQVQNKRELVRIMGF